MGEEVFLIVEDDAACGRALVRMLRHVGVCRVVASVRDALGAIEERAWAGLIVDLGLPDGSGFQVIEAAKASDSERPCMLLTGHLDASVVNRAFDLGAGYVLKPATDSRIVGFAKRALCREGEISERLKTVVNSFRARHGLTAGEAEVLLQAARGSSRIMIAELRQSTPSTVKKHIANLSAKTGQQFDEVVNHVLRTAMSPV